MIRRVDQVLEGLGRICSKLGMAEDMNRWIHMVGEAKTHLGVVFVP